MAVSVQHTPGPWEWELSADENGAETIAILGADGAPVFRGAYFTRGDDEDDANANLIVAAPDLLDALRNLLACHKAAAAPEGIFSDQQVRQWFDAGWKRARAALENARAKSEAAPPASV